MRRVRLPLLKDQRGVSLVLALGVLVTISSLGAVALRYTATNTRSAWASQARTDSRTIAEAGIAHALSILNEAADPLDPASLTSTTVNLDLGTASVTASLSGQQWTITAVGASANPTGAADVEQSVTATAEVRGVVPGATPEYWNRLYHDSTRTCLKIRGVEIPYNVASRGDICLRNGASITGSDTIVEAGDDIYTRNSTSIGSAGTPVSEVHVADRCRKRSHTAHRPCTPADNVWANVNSRTPTHLQRPTVDIDYWYANAKPGPMHYCDNPGGSFPNGFDTDTVHNNSRSGRTSIAEITPRGLSYTCQAHDSSGALVGEISWNHNTGVLKIHGTIFIDGDVRFDDDGDIINYQGRGIIVSADDVEFDEVVCAGGDGTHDCWTSGMSNWDPDQNLLIVLSADDSEYDQGSTWPRRPGALQGILYAGDRCTIHQHFKLSGPVNCGRVHLPFNEAWPEYFDWPPLGDLIDAQLYGSPTTWSDHTVVTTGIYG